MKTSLLRTISLFAFCISAPALAQMPSGLPDLQVNLDQTLRSLEISTELFQPNSCSLQESCVKGPGMRKLLRFDTAIENVSNSDLILGPPDSSPFASLSSCHGHYHVGDVATYELVPLSRLVSSNSSNPVAVTRKQGFCLMDSIPISDETGSSRKYNCDFQGISSGWADVYYADYDCQWLDVTDVTNGDYALIITVNPERVFEEADYSNNQITIPIRIS